jgi:SAM-dependent methyltransferase
MPKAKKMKKQEYSTMYHYEEKYWWYVGLHEFIKHFIIKFSKNDFSKKILDAGCGTGRMLQILKNFENSEGFDISEDAINFAKKRDLKNIKVQDLNTWIPINNNYDFIISADVICCKGIDDIEICKKFYSALKKQGKLILNLPALDILSRNHDIAVFIAKRYKRKLFENELKTIGFNIINSTYRLPMLYFLILFLKIFEKKQSENEVISDLKPIPKIINKLFLINNRIENFFLKFGLKFPFGSSLFIIAEK